MKKCGICFMLVMTLVLVGCNGDSNSENEERWEAIVVREFNAFNLMGEAIYFYEKDGTYYCDFWMSGSGVPVIFFHTSEVEFDEDGHIVMDVPSIMMDGTFKSFDTTLENVIVEYSDGVIYLNEVIYEDVGLNTRDQALDWISSMN